MHTQELISNFTSHDPFYLVSTLLYLDNDNDRCLVLHGVLWRKKLRISWIHVAYLLECFTAVRYKKEALDRILFCTKPGGFFGRAAVKILRNFPMGELIPMLEILLRQSDPAILEPVLRNFRFFNMATSDNLRYQVLQTLIDKQIVKFEARHITPIVATFQTITYRERALNLIEFASLISGSGRCGHLRPMALCAIPASPERASPLKSLTRCKLRN